jgi:hypothetical protein
MVVNAAKERCSFQILLRQKPSLDKEASGKAAYILRS